MTDTVVWHDATRGDQARMPGGWCERSEPAGIVETQEFGTGTWRARTTAGRWRGQRAFTGTDGGRSPIPVSGRGVVGAVNWSEGGGWREEEGGWWAVYQVVSGCQKELYQVDGSLGATEIRTLVGI